MPSDEAMTIASETSSPLVPNSMIQSRSGIAIKTFAITVDHFNAGTNIACCEKSSSTIFADHYVTS